MRTLKIKLRSFITFEEGRYSFFGTPPLLPLDDCFGQKTIRVAKLTAGSFNLTSARFFEWRLAFGSTRILSALIAPQISKSFAGTHVFISLKTLIH